MNGLAIAQVQYIRAATFITIPIARAVYQRLHDQVLERWRDIDFGVLAGAYDETTFFVVVTSLQTLPDEVQQFVEEALGAGTAWEPPTDLVLSVVRRRIRQMLEQQGALESTGFRLVEHHGFYEMIDEAGFTPTERQARKQP